MVWPRRAIFWAFLAAWSLGAWHEIAGAPGRFVGMDFLLHFHALEAFFERGEWPSRGHITSLGSFAPPGTAWLLLPGWWFFDDLRRAETVGTLVLHGFTLWGIAVLGARIGGEKTAILAMLFYASSPRGLFFASSLWPVGHTVFVIWLVVFAARWITEKRARFLCGALLTWAAGGFVFLATAPTIFLLPFAAFLGKIRPPLRSILPVFGAAATVSLALWWPYLQFQSERGWADLWSQISRENIWPQAAPLALPDVSLREKTAPIAWWPLPEIGRNFSDFPLIGIAFAILCAATALALVWNRKTAPEARFVGAALLVLWCFLLLVAENGKGYRFFQLAALQSVVWAVFWTQFWPRRALWRKAAMLFLAVYLAANFARPLGRPRGESDQFRVVQTLAKLANGRAIRVGYAMPFHEEFLRGHALDSRYKIGGEFDYFLRRGWNIENQTQTAWGFSPHDDFRVFASAPKLGPTRFRALAWRDAKNGWALVAQFGPYEIRRRATFP